MNESEHKLVFSEHSRRFSNGEVTIRVDIYRFEHETKWAMEAVREASTLTAWKDTFDTDTDALAEFIRTLADEGYEALAYPKEQNSSPAVRGLTARRTNASRAQPPAR